MEEREMCSGENGRREDWFWKRLSEDESQRGAEVGRGVWVGQEVWQGGWRHSEWVGP